MFSPSWKSAFSPRLLAALCLGIGLAGCGATSPESEEADSSPRNGVEGKETVLAELNVGYGTIRFHELTAPDGTKQMAISEMAPATMKTTPLEAMQEHELTALEAFKAIAPDRAVPAAIAEAHEAQALALGRSDTAVHTAFFDRGMRVEQTVAGCESFVYASPDVYSSWWTKLGRTNVSGDWWLNVGTVVDDYNYSTAGKVTLGVCNESNAPISARLAYDDREDSTGWIYWGIATLNPGSAWRWWNFSNTRYNCPNLPPGNICVHQVPISYGVWGNSLSGKYFHQRTATVGPKLCTTNSQCPSSYACNGTYCYPVIR